MQLFVSVFYPFMYVHNMYMCTKVVQIFVLSTDMCYLQYYTDIRMCYHNIYLCSVCLADQESCSLFVHHDVKLCMMHIQIHIYTEIGLQ